MRALRGLLATCVGRCVTGCDQGATPAASDATLDATDAADVRVTTDAPDDDDRIVVPDDVPAVGDPLALDVRRAGPFHTGHRVLSITYTPRGSSGPRTLPLHVWYPTHAIAGPHPTYGRFFADPEAIDDAPLAPSAYAAGYPVHIYSHGDRGFAGTSHFLMRYFASHGWVVAAPEHVLNTLFDTPDPRPFTLYHLRAQDVSAALDTLAALPATDPLAGRLVTRRALLSGHSFGTHTVWSAAGATFDAAAVAPMCTDRVRCNSADVEVFRAGLGDARFVAGIAMAGSINRSLFGADGHRSVRIPLLSMSGTDDPVGADAQFMSTLPVDLTWIDVRGGCHQYFALGGCENIPDALQAPIVGAWSLAFARRHVLDDRDATVAGVLDGSIPLSDRVTLHRRP